MNGAITNTAPFKTLVADLLDQAKALGASAAEAGVNSSRGLSVTARMGEVETIEHTRDHGLGVTLYFGQRKGSASTTDFHPDSIRATVQAAADIARAASADPCSGLAPQERLADPASLPELDLYHPWQLDSPAAGEIAISCEQAARDYDAAITNSEGATVNLHEGSFVFGNSNGFIGGYPSTRHSISCSVIGGSGDAMERDYWWYSARRADDLQGAEEIGRRAAQRTLARLGARRVRTGQFPVVFQAEVAAGLLRSLTGALRGSSLYRKASFLRDRLDEQLFPAWLRIHEQPHLARGLGSAPFDNEGVSTESKDIITQGRIATYLLDQYSACKLNLETTGNAGGARNVTVSAPDPAPDLEALLREMGTGLLVTEVMGQGVNLVTGDYSRGASGFWVENGTIVHPVSEITIAGNLNEMFGGLVAVAADDDIPGSTRTGSWLMERMTIAGD